MVSTDSDRVPRPAWLPLAAAAVIVPTALAGLTFLWPRPQIEDHLTRAGGKALAAAGFTGAAVDLEGRDATISGVPASADRQRAIDSVEAVTGVRVAEFPDAGSDGGTGGGSDGASTAPAAPAPAPTASPFGIARRGEDVVLTGVVGSGDERATLLAAATAQAGGRRVVDELTVTGGAPLPTGVVADSVGAAAAAAAGAGGDLAATLSGGGASLTGTVADDAARATTLRAFQGALPGVTVTDQLTVAAGSDSGGGSSGTELDDAAKLALQSSLDQLLAGEQLTFGPDSPELTAEGAAIVPRVLELVRPAAAARLQLDGFVAAGRGNGKLSAQELSDRRAATVRDALVAGGIPADHITARGLGEGTSPEQQAAGRRVEIHVV